MLGVGCADDRVLAAAAVHAATTNVRNRQPLRRRHDEVPQVRAVLDQPIGRVPARMEVDAGGLALADDLEDAALASFDSDWPFAHVSPLL